MNCCALALSLTWLVSSALSACLLVYEAPIGLRVEVGIGDGTMEILIEESFGNGKIAESEHDA